MIKRWNETNEKTRLIEEWKGWGYAKPLLNKNSYYQLTNNASHFGIIAHGEILTVGEDGMIEYMDEKYDSWHEVFWVDEETFEDEKGYLYNVWHRWDGIMEIVETITNH